MNLLAYALTLLFRTPLPEVLRERVMDRWAPPTVVVARVPDDVVDLDGRRVEAVSGGAHWGGGLIVPARDLALIGQLFLDRGTHAGTRLLSAEWADQSGLRARLNGSTAICGASMSRCRGAAPATGRSARGNGGRHLWWVDPARNSSSPPTDRGTARCDPGSLSRHDRAG